MKILVAGGAGFRFQATIAPAASASEEDWRRHFEINVHGPELEALRDVVVAFAGWNPYEAVPAYIVVIAHGGDPDPDRLARPVDSVEVSAERTGFVTGIYGRFVRRGGR